MELLIVIFIYTLPLWLGLVAVAFVRTFVLKEDSYSRDWISGLIMLWASREFFRGLRFHKRK
jgi:hypothetical protein